jgi:hypothetical protein
MAARGRPIGANVSTIDLDGDPRRDVARVAGIFCLGLDLRKNENLGSIPAMDAHAPVLLPVDVQQSRRGDALLTHFAKPHAVVVIPVAPFATVVHEIVASTTRVAGGPLPNGRNSESATEKNRYETAEDCGDAHRPLEIRVY